MPANVWAALRCRRPRPQVVAAAVVGMCLGATLMPRAPLATLVGERENRPETRAEELLLPAATPAASLHSTRDVQQHAAAAEKLAESDSPRRSALPARSEQPDRPDGEPAAPDAAVTEATSSTPAAVTTPEKSLAETHQEMMAKRMQERSDRIRKYCAKYHFMKKSGKSRDVFYDKDNSLLWCPVFKAASSNWLGLFCDLHKVKWPRMQPGQTCPINELRRYLGQITSRLLESAQVNHAFLVVRHPLERILSAFRDKLECTCPQDNSPCNPFCKSGYVLKSKKMIGRHRKRDSTPRPVSRDEFRKVAEPPQHHHVAPLTFAEFIRSVGAADVIDEHWKPFYAMCTPCNHKFDLIGHFETLSEDQPYILSQTGLTEKLGRAVKLAEHANRNRKGPSDNRTLVAQYYSQVTRSELLKVIAVYKLDFEMFGYSYDEYLAYAKPDQKPDR